MVQAKCTVNRTATILHKLTLEIDYNNPKSFELKQLHLLNIVNHFVSGRRSLQRLAKCIDQFTRNWSSGKFAITEKEQTLMYYLLFMRAAELRESVRVMRLRRLPYSLADYARSQQLFLLSVSSLHLIAVFPHRSSG